MNQLAEVETARAVAHPWYCDQMGHMNARHIYAVFDDAGFQLLGILERYLDAESASSHGWGDVKVEVDFIHEISTGTLLLVKSGLVAIGNSSVRSQHTMYSKEGQIVHAKMQATTVYFDLQARKSRPLPESFRSRAAALS